ncbi:MAG: neutral/alkaline non-lysosomal ceramidase N-terminal domain-containing protein [Bacteroidota bacterium]
MKKVIRWLLGFIAVLILIVAAMVGSIDRTPLHEQQFYNDMMGKLDTIRIDDHGSGELRSGWKRVNITPSMPMPMAGYIPRDHFDIVHDSLFARVLVIENASFRCAMVNVDLLIFPPLLRDKIVEKLNDNTFLYLSATHTHNGVGGWDPSIGGRLITGKFSEEYVEGIADKIVAAIKGITTLTSSIQYYEAEATDMMENRVDVDSGKVDGKIRGIMLERVDRTSALLFILSAHATSLKSEMLELSADYPGKIMRNLQSFTFPMFMSGMVGSTRFQFSPLQNYEFIDTVSKKVWTHLEKNYKVDSIKHAPVIRSAHIPIEFGPSQLRIDKNFKLNNWAFRILFRKLKGELTYLEIGDIVFIGTPCDFSSEIYVMDSLESYAAKYNKHLIITSFNGDYDGYITYDKHYEVSSKEEINALNWVGPYYGEYFSDMIKKVVAK